MDYRIITHCHTLHSFDSELQIEDIVRECNNNRIKAIIICDHDKWGITLEEEKMFVENGIILIRAIEFTTKKGVHIIGISPSINLLEREKNYYDIIELIDKLKSLEAYIIIPHPDHETGVIGNAASSEEEIEYALKNAEFAEFDNYNYGKTKSIDRITKANSNIKFVVGSDAHIKKYVCAKYNELEIESQQLSQNDVLMHLSSKQANMISKMERSRSYWAIKRIKASCIYQFFLNLFPEKTRRRIKSVILKRI